jgi:hypothetical protein
MLTDAAESGELTEAELRTALVNGDWTPFDPHTVRMMIRMFDTNRSGSVNFDEFWYLLLAPFLSYQDLKLKRRSQWTMGLPLCLAQPLRPFRSRSQR